MRVTTTIGITNISFVNNGNNPKKTGIIIIGRFLTRNFNRENVYEIGIYLLKRNSRITSPITSEIDIPIKLWK